MWYDEKTVVVVDYEFRQDANNLPVPVCYVAKNLKTQETIKHWITGSETAPLYPLSSDCIFVAYAANAEVSCHLALNFELPVLIIDLFAEFRRLHNGKTRRNSLIVAGEFYGLPPYSELEKERMRNLILGSSIYTEEEKKAILDYCEKDVLYTEALFHKMKDEIDAGVAFGDGRYMRCLAQIERYGIPVDAVSIRKLKENWGDVKLKLIADLDRDYGVFEGTVLKQELFAKFLETSGLYKNWEKTPSGLYCTRDDYLKTKASVYPELQALYELKTTLSQLRVQKLFVGEDGRNRANMCPFISKTGRNQPSSTEYIFANTSWLRHYIKPSPGMAVAYLDYSFQEIAIAAALSGDKQLQKDCLSGDVYLSFGKNIGLIPANGNKITHQKERDICKRCFLGTNYGQTAYGFASVSGLPEEQAQDIMKRHYMRYRTFWDWILSYIKSAQIDNCAKTSLGWNLDLCSGETKPNTIQNFPFQSTGSEILRLATNLCFGRGIKVIALVHDAVMIESSLENIDFDVAMAEKCMVLAGTSIIGFPLKVAVDQIVRYPDNYIDKRGSFMYEKVTNILDVLEEKNDK
jgi:hypothetical protein